MGRSAIRYAVCEGLLAGDDGGFLDGHVSAFDFFGGGPLSILYDNTTLAVAKVCGEGKRAFMALQSPESAPWGRAEQAGAGVPAITLARRRSALASGDAARSCEKAAMRKVWPKWTTRPKGYNHETLTENAT